MLFYVRTGSRSRRTGGVQWNKARMVAATFVSAFDHQDRHVLWDLEWRELWVDSYEKVVG